MEDKTVNKTYKLEAVKTGLQTITEIIIKMKEDLTDIDSKLGDGDMGSSMEKGALALQAVVAEASDRMTIKDFFMKCGMAFNKAAPSTMGTLLSGGMMEIARQFADREALTEADVAAIPGILAAAISRRGKSKEGDKTILDSLIPFSATLEAQYHQSTNLPAAWQTAVLKAAEGMERTKGIIAKTGRAKWLGERNKEYPDGGAYMCYKIVESMVNASEKSV